MKKLTALYIGGLVYLIGAVLPALAALNGVLLPPPSGQSPTHLLVLLHGYGSNEQDLLPLGDGLNKDYAVLSLRAPLVLGSGRYAWYRQGESARQDIIRAEDGVATRIAQLQQQLAIAPSATILGGFSQGAVVSWAIALDHPALVAGVAIFSGRLPISVSTRDVSVRPLPLPKVFVGHGQLDSRITLGQATQAVALAQQRGYSVAFHRYPQLGHGISQQELTDFSAWAATLTPRTP